MNRQMTRAAVPCSLALAALVWAMSGTSAAPRAAGDDVRVPDLSGRNVDPFEPPAGTRATVFVFVTTDCPISNRYAPEIRRLYEMLLSRGVAFWLVYPNASDSVDVIRNHLRTYAYLLPVLRDPEHALVKRSGVTVTPEAAVYDARQHLVYRGRIDNRYASLGVMRPRATRRDLERAITATLASERVVDRITQPVGCLIGDRL